MRTLFAIAVVAAALVASSAAQERQVYKIGNGVKAPILVKEVKPQYTTDAKARGVHGIVEMSVIVQADGTVGDHVEITKSLDPDLDEQAIVAVRQWRFKPGTKDGQAVDVEVQIEMSFTLK